MRLKTLKIVITGFFILLVCGAFYVQVIRAPYYVRLAKNNRIRVVSIGGPRGDIYDRNGKLIVTSRASFDCIAIPQELTDKESSLLEVSRILGLDPSAVKRRFKKGYLNPFTPVVLAEDISKDKAIKIEEKKLEAPGIFVTARPLRHYLYADAIAHLVGYIGEIGRKELDRLTRYGYRMRDYIGKTGIEKEYDNYLRGINGGMQIEVDSRGRQVRVLSSREPSSGKDLFLAVDIELQEYIHNVFEAKKGACIVMDPETGEVLSFVSKPSFDPNLFATSDIKLKKILRDSKKPLLNRAISGTYPPGSSFKVVVAGAALNDRRIKNTTSFVCNGRYILGGRTFHCWREEGHGVQDVTSGIKNSCNVFFYNTGLLIGPDNISRYAQRFGFGKPTGIDIPEEKGGLVPSKLWKKIKMGKKWYDGETANYAIGQGYLLVTPLQIARMMAVVANRGFLVRPHVVKKIESIDVSGRAKRRVGISKEVLDTVAVGLRKVVMDESGTGTRARSEGVSAAGKTGTAQTGRGTTHAWFAGFAPTDEPKIAIVVFLEEGGRGGLNAAGLAGKIFAKAKELDIL